MKKTKDVACEILHVLRSAERENQRTDLRVVVWTVGKRSYRRLEKRLFFKGQYGDWKTGKAKGFSADDLDVIQANLPKITAALGSKPKPAAAAPSTNGHRPSTQHEDF